MRLQASAAFGLEALVERQLKDLGFGETTIDHGHVCYESDWEGLILSNLALREADRVYIELGSFPAESYDQFFEGVRSLAWADWLPRDARFPVQARTVKSKLHSPSDLQALAKKAIADRLGSAYGLTNLPETGALFPIRVQLREDQCTLLLDSTGDGLYKRGYRTKIGGAPLKETLAAGLVDLSFWKPSRPLVDPFCGSGTLLIEAARKARRMDPGLDRDFLFRHWPGLGEDRYLHLRRERLARIDRTVQLDIRGFDIDPQMIRTARDNADQAGLLDDILFLNRDMREAHLQENFGILLTNPPYGERMGEKEEVEALMADFVDHFFSLKTWSFYVITAMTNFETLAGRPADRRRKLFNGGIETNYYQFYGPDPEDFL